MSLQIQTLGKGPWGPARGFPSLQGQNVKSRGPACVYKHVCSGDRVPRTAYQEAPLLGKSHPAQRHGEQTTGAPRLVTFPSATVNLAPADPGEPQETLGALELRPSPPIPPPPVGLGQLSPRLVQSPPPPSGQLPTAPGADRVLGRWLPGKVRALATRTLPSRFPLGGPDTLTPHPNLRDPKKEWQSHWHQQQVHLRGLPEEGGCGDTALQPPAASSPGGHGLALLWAQGHKTEQSREQTG